MKKHHRNDPVFRDIETEEIPGIVKLESKSSDNDITPTLSLPTLGEFISHFAPLSIDIVGMTFFFDERIIFNLIRMYWKKSDDIPTPISVAIAGQNSDDDQTTRYHIIDGRKNLTILLAAVIEAAKRVGMGVNDIAGLNEINFQDNTDKGTLAEFLSNPDDFGDDVCLFMDSIHSILDFVEENGDLNTFLRAVLNGKIACTAFEMAS